MRLTALLFRRDRLPNGHIFRGKDHLVRKVLPVNLTKMRDRYEIEEQNMIYLRFPYLTAEQSFGHAKALGKREAYINQFRVEAANKFKNHSRLSDHLNHLKVKEAWD